MRSDVHDAERFRIVVARTCEDRDLFDEFLRGQASCYADFTATSAMPPLDPDTPGLRVVCFVDDRGRVRAGVRIHARGAEAALPMEAILAESVHLRARLDAAMNDGGVAELCGLWASKADRGTGIGGAIIGAAVAVAPLAGVKTMCSFAHQFNRFTRDVGFEPDLDIGEHPYPDERYRSSVYFCEAHRIASASATVRAEILRVRSMFERGGEAVFRPDPLLRRSTA